MDGSVWMPATCCDETRLLRETRRDGGDPLACGAWGAEARRESGVAGEARATSRATLDLRFLVFFLIDLTASRDGSLASMAWMYVLLIFSTIFRISSLVWSESLSPILAPVVYDEA
jgi:hypothetical protein